MDKIGIFFGSSSGVTERIAEMMKEKLADSAELFNVDQAKAAQLADYSNIILGCSTWGTGELQDDMVDFVAAIADVDLAGKKVAIFGLGDQMGHDDTYCNAIAIINDAVKARGAAVIGATSAEGYEFEHSDAVVDGKFLGLALDEDNQDDMTEARIDAWLADLKGQFN